MNSVSWTITELKTEAKKGLSQNYWRSVLVALLLSIVIGGGNSGSVLSYRNYMDYESNNHSLYAQDSDILYGLSSQELKSVAAVVSGVIVITLLVSIVLNLFLFGPLHVGCARYSQLAVKYPAQLNLGRGFSVNYWNVVKTMFMKGLFTVLWTVLYFFVFAIIDTVVTIATINVSYELFEGVMFLLVIGLLAVMILLGFKLFDYKMVPYILASDPNMDWREVMRISKAMVAGKKKDIFFLNLSFIGWYLLTAMISGILAAIGWGILSAMASASLLIFYIDPYVMLTEGALFHRLSERVGFTIDMQGDFLTPAGGGMADGNSATHEEMYNSLYSNGDFNKDDGSSNDNGISGYLNSGDNYNSNNNNGYETGGYPDGGSYNNGSNSSDGYWNGGYPDGGNYNNGSNSSDSYDQHDQTGGYGHPASDYDNEPKKEQDGENIDFF